MSDASNTPAASDQGRTTALVVYVLYLLSIPSAWTLALIGVVIAFASRENAVGVWRAHLDRQIRIWVIALLWSLALLVVAIVGALLTIILIGFPILWLVGIGFFVVMVWFTVVSLLGFLSLLEGRAP